MKAFFRRVVINSLIVATVAALVLPPVAPTTPVRAFLACFIGFLLAYTVLYAGVVVSDYVEKKRLADKYGCRIRVGNDSFQERTLKVENPPPDLMVKIEAALRKTDPKVKVEEKSAQRLVAAVPRERGILASLITIEIEDGGRDAVRLRVATKPTGRGHLFLRDNEMHFDLGRAIRHVEEFQRELQRVLV
jgi:hypothetical protein